jgi:hypothetical protein
MSLREEGRLAASTASIIKNASDYPDTATVAGLLSRELSCVRLDTREDF